jgi:hypothetical protein
VGKGLSGCVSRRPGAGRAGQNWARFDQEEISGLGLTSGEFLVLGDLF